MPRPASATPGATEMPSSTVFAVSKRRRPWGLKWRSHTAFILGTVAVGIFTDLLLYAMFLPILPFMLRDRIHVPPEDVQSRIDYLIAVYAGGSVLFSPVAGLFADKITSRQLPFLLGLTALFVATLLFAVGESLWIAYLARLLQGISAAVVWTIGMAMVVETVGAKHVGKAFGTMFTFITPGAILSPTIGGAIYARAGYASVFIVGGAVLVVDFILRLLIIEKSVAKSYLDEDEEEVIEDEGGDAEANAEGQTEASEEAPLLKVNSIASYRIPPGQSERMTKYPFLYCMKDPSFIAAMFIALVHALMCGSFDATLAKFGEELFGFDSLQAGLLFIPLGVIDAMLSPFIGWLIDRVGTKRIGTPGFLFLCPIFVAFRAVTENTHEQLVLCCILLSLTGLGFAVVGGLSMIESGLVVERYFEANKSVFNDRPPYATLYGLQSMVFMLGLAVGPLVAGGLKDWIGFGNMNCVWGAAALITSFVCWFFLGRKPRLVGEET